MIKIFDYEKLKLNREKAADNIQKSNFFREAAEDIIDRLRIIDRNFSNILDIESRGDFLSQLLVQNYKSAIVEVASAFQVEEWGPGDKKFDLVTFSLGLNWINDVQKFLSNVKKFLKPDGIFIGNFIGGNSLKNLRMKFIEAEIAANKPHFQHIMPFIHFDHVTPLFQHAGFVEVIIDYENLELSYDSPLEFIRLLKNIGESGAFATPSFYSISKDVYNILQSKKGGFTEQINIISFIASPNKNSIKLFS